MGGMQRLGTRRELNSPYGGELINLQVGPDRVAELKATSRDLVSLDLTPRQLSDLEMLATGAFSPLTSFMGQADYEAVCAPACAWPMAVSGLSR